MNKKLLSVAVVSATVATQVSPFVAAEPTVELKDAPILRDYKLANPGAAPVGTIDPGTATAITKQGKQKVLCLMLNMSNSPFTAGHNEQYYADALFGSAPDSVKNFINNQSGGRVVVEPADTKDSPVKGVIKLDVDATKYGTIGAGEYNSQKTLVVDAVKAVKDRVDWAAIDQDGNKTFEESFLTDNPNLKEELLVVTIVSGEAEATNSKVDGHVKVWPHLTELTTELTSGSTEYKFLNSAVVASEKAGTYSVNSTVLSHEYLHNLNARDMYRDTGSIGPWSAMCDTYGKRPGGTAPSPTPLDPIHKLYMGWSAAKQYTPGKTDVEIAFNKNEVPYIQHPTNPDIVYVLDYRDYTDENVKALNGFGVTGDGMVVWKINKTEAKRDWLKGQGDDNDWYVNSKGPATAMRVLAKGNAAATVENSFVPVGSVCDVDGLSISVAVQDKKMVIKGTDVAKPDPKPEVEEKLTIEAIDREITVGDAFDPLAGIVVRNSKNEIVQAKLSLVNSTVNPDKDGSYTVTVKATLGTVTAEKTYKVTVKPKEIPVKLPVINAENKVIMKGDIFNAKDGVTAVDGEGNDITASIKVGEIGVKTDVPGVYQVTYEVADKNGNKATKTITVTVKDTPAKPEPQKPDSGDTTPDDSANPVPTPDPAKDSTPPVFDGVKDAVIKIGEEFDLLKDVTAKDEKDGSVKVQVMPTKLDTSKPGRFTLTYYAFDKSGNMASHERTIEVIKSKTAGESNVADKVAPEITLFANKFSFPAGNRINPLCFVKATDNVDGDLTNKVKVVGEMPDLAKPGNHAVKVAVTDKAGNTKEEVMKFVITEGKSAIFAPDIKIHAGAKFDVLEGVTAISKSGVDLTDKLKADVSDLDSAKPGTYSVTYKLMDDKEEVSLTRKVTVVPEGDDITRPTIKFKNSVLKLGEKFDPLAGVESNGKAKLISGTVDTEYCGVYHLVYEAEGNNGLKTQAIRRVVVLPESIDASAPYIFVLDNRVPVGEEFNAKTAALVVDKEDGLLNHKLLIEKSDVDTNKVGRYTVKFSAIDSDANATSHVANIDVVARPLSDLSKPGEDNVAKPVEGESNSAKPGNSTQTGGNSAKPGFVPQAMGNLPKTGTTVMGFGAAIGAFVSGILRFRRKY